MTFTINDSKRNRITKRINTIKALIDKHGIDSLMLRNYLSDCMESDIRRTKLLVNTQKKGEVE